MGSVNPSALQLPAYFPPVGATHLDLALAIIHHTMVCSHGLVGVQGGGIEGDLRNFSYAADGVGLGDSRRLVFVFPVTEELLKQSHLATSGDDLDLQKRCQARG